MTHTRKLSITKTNTPKPIPKNEELTFGTQFSDHMFTWEWAVKEGWQDPKIVPYQKLSLDPSAIVFHYAIECFEGLKAYKDSQGNIRLFRPDKNIERLFNSGKRIALPEINKEEFLEYLKELIKLETNWIPNEKGYSLYIRPTYIGTEPYIGVSASKNALLYIICCPVGPYYATGFQAVSLLATQKYVRAWPGGTGGSKIGGNYAPGLVPQVGAQDEGCQQLLWLFGEEEQITEVGTMNCFIYWTNEQGEKELITSALDGTILPGVTRDSIIELAKEMGLKVTEGKVTMPELVKAQREGRIIEMFGSGTACIISPIKEIKYKGDTFAIPLDPNDPKSQSGPLATKLFNQILAIQYGDVDHPWSVKL